MIPDYQSLMLPVLQYVANGQEYRMLDVIQGLAKSFKLSDEELASLIPSGQTPLFSNRVHWAKTYLKKSGLVDSPKRGSIAITNDGKKVLSENPLNINVKYLRRFPQFVEFHTFKKLDFNSETIVEEIKNQTPEELIDSGYVSIRKALEEDIITKLKTVHPAFFERIVVELLVKMGYGGSIAEAGRATRYSNDEGIDGIIKEDKLGLDVIYIQAKRWEGVVSRPEIQRFVGALAGQRAKKGVFITTSSFSKDAIVYSSQMDTKIVLIDGEQLAQYMIDYNLGVSVINTYEIKKLDSDYFDVE